MLVATNSTKDKEARTKETKDNNRLIAISRAIISSAIVLIEDYTYS